MNEPLPILLPTSVLDEYQSLTTGAGYINFSDRSRIEISGSDRSNFLHSFCTNDINALTPGTGCEAFLCNPKGKIVGHVAVFCHSDRLVLDTAANQAAALIEHLSRYIIMEDVQLADCSATQSQVFICGAQAHEVLKRVIGHDLPQTAWSHCESRIPEIPAVCYSVPFLRQPGFLLATATEHFEPLVTCLQHHGLVNGQQATWEVLRIESGWPQYGTDISEDNLPQEVGRDTTAINFNKGCYLGQETVARIDAVGHVNRRLVQIDCKSPSPVSAQAILTHDERAVGVVTSAGYSPKQQGAIALGYLQQTLAKPGQSLAVESRTVVIMNVLNS
ncbi:MAG: glycine cleavage T C-terminal barrel domain-containing protein [Planctomycetota bacterium]|nr:glycine cleavage T C-terminal barrel domain-containing protein [Planctomycetota bacterium]